MKARIEEHEVPYETLAKYGLTREMIEDLPIHVLEDIGQGRRSPVLPIQVEDENENVIKSRTRFAFVQVSLVSYSICIVLRNGVRHFPLGNRHPRYPKHLRQ